MRYDFLLQENRINAYMRQSIHRALLRTFEPGNRLIELGCGTGDDAIVLATHGCEIFALDPSSKMIELATKKASASQARQRVRFFVGRGEDLLRNLPEIPHQQAFDGAYASFSLSYEPDLRTVSEALADRVRAGGQLLIAAMNRLCGVELAVALLSGHPQLAGRRLGRQTLHKVGGYSTLVFPRTTAELVDAFQRHFVLEEERALPAILPPHYANRLLAKWPMVVDMMSKIDPYVGTLPMIRRLGDHNLLRFRRRR